MSRSQGIGIMAILVLIAGIVGWSFVKSRTAAVSRITFQPPAQASTVAPTTAKKPPEPLNGNARDGTAALDASASAASEVPPALHAEIVVQVAGAVHKPGVYHLKEGARNDDALKAAGGPTNDANTASVNLAARAQDGSQIYIKTTQEQPSGGASDDPITVASTNTTTKKPETAHPHASKSPSKKSDTGSKPTKLTNPSQGRININAAGAEELQRIPGIGPSMAERLITYRQENHGFQSVEDLMQVSGIGEKKFAKMQPYVKVK